MKGLGLKLRSDLAREDLGIPVVKFLSGGETENAWMFKEQLDSFHAVSSDDGGNVVMQSNDGSTMILVMSIDLEEV